MEYENDKNSNTRRFDQKNIRNCLSDRILGIIDLQLPEHHDVSDTVVRKFPTLYEDTTYNLYLIADVL